LNGIADQDLNFEFTLLCGTLQLLNLDRTTLFYYVKTARSEMIPDKTFQMFIFCIRIVFGGW